MIEERSLGVKAPYESKVARPCKENGRERDGEAEYATERHIFNMEMKVLKPFFKCQLYV